MSSQQVQTKRWLPVSPAHRLLLHSSFDSSSRSSQSSLVTAHARLICEFHIGRKRFRLLKVEEDNQIIIREITERRAYSITVPVADIPWILNTFWHLILGLDTTQCGEALSDISVSDRTNRRGRYCMINLKGRSICIPYGYNGTGWTRWSTEILRGSLEARIDIKPRCLAGKRALSDELSNHGADTKPLMPQLIDLNPHYNSYNNDILESGKEFDHPARSNCRERIGDQHDDRQSTLGLSISRNRPDETTLSEDIGSQLTWEELSGNLNEAPLVHVNVICSPTTPAKKAYQTEDTDHITLLRQDFNLIPKDGVSESKIDLTLDVQSGYGGHSQSLFSHSGLSSMGMRQIPSTPRRSARLTPSLLP